MSGAMAAMFVVSLVIPEAFADLPGGLCGPIVLAVAYLVVRLVHIGRVALATDGYTYLHLVLIAGIVISALGVEEVIAGLHDDGPLGLFGACALLGGTALYLAGHALFWRRVGGTWKVFRLAGATLLVALIPAAALASPLVALAAVVGIAVALVAIETNRYSDKRAALRAGTGR